MRRHQTSAHFADMDELVEWDQAFSSGRTLTVTLEAPHPDRLRQGERIDFDVQLSESHERVRASVRKTGTVWVTNRTAARPCRSSTWALTARLIEPLGQRALVCGRSGEVRPSTQLETRLEPTWLPHGLFRVQGGRHLPRQYEYFANEVDAHRAPSMIELLTSPITMRPRLHGLRDLHGFEPVSIRRRNDGVVASVGDSRPVVGFEEQGWFYRLSGSQHIDPDDLVRCARSFERPTLFSSPLPAPLLPPAGPIRLQPGQMARM